MVLPCLFSNYERTYLSNIKLIGQKFNKGIKANCELTQKNENLAQGEYVNNIYRSIDV